MTIFAGVVVIVPLHNFEKKHLILILGRDLNLLYTDYSFLFTLFVSIFFKLLSVSFSVRVGGVSVWKLKVDVSVQFLFYGNSGRGRLF